jgi:polysaccharide export outer membrane protein
MTGKITFYISVSTALILSAGCGILSPGPEEVEMESTPTPESTPPAAPTPSPFLRTGGENIYRIGPGDIMEIMVYGEPEISGNFRVSPEGTIAWAWVGNVEVAGLSSLDISELLRNILVRDYIHQPRIEVQVKEYRSQVVYIFGNIRIPGITRLGENRSLLQNLLLAGGPRVWGEGTVTVLRTTTSDEGQDKFAVNLQSLLRGESDLLLENGDIITVSVPEAGEAFLSENRVYIVGSVNSPGAFPWRDGMTVLDVLMEASGLAEYAAGNRARLVRGQGEAQEEIPLRLGDLLEGDKDKNMLVLPGDLINVPESFF